MRNVIKDAIIFAAGATLGGLLAWRILDRAYAAVAEEEENAEREERLEHLTDIRETLKNLVPVENEEVKVEKDSYISEAKAYSVPAMDEIDKERIEAKRYDWPYIIKPEEFGDLDYEPISLTLYADGFLTDDAGDIVEDPDDIVGLENLDRIGEYEDDAIHVRNDSLMCDYEILMDRRNYSDVKEE